jgi:hypothetical protein
MTTQICVSTEVVGDGVLVKEMRIADRLSVNAQSQADGLDFDVKLKILVFKILGGELGILVFMVSVSIAGGGLPIEIRPISRA